MAFWSKVKSLMDKKWKDGKQKIQEKVDRLENTYKGARTQTGKVGNIRVGDRELGEEDEEDEAPFKAGVEVNNAEAQVLRKDPRFRDWSKGRPQLKKNVFFRALPESPKPPPHDPNSGNLVLFFRKSKFKI